MNREAIKRGFAWLALLLGFAGVWSLQRKIDQSLGAMHQEEDDLVLRSGPLLKIVSLEYAPFIADVYWTRVVQYYGSKEARGDANVRLLWPLLDVTTTLDPHLIVAYRFGSTFLSQQPPNGAGRPDLAIDLIRRGIRENPEYWRFYEDLGFIYYFELKDYKSAAEAFLEGSQKPGAMIWMKTFAAKISEQGGSRDISKQLWTEIYESATDPTIKNNALIHLKLLKADADCEQLDLLVAEFTKREGHAPASLRNLVAAGLLSGFPADPEGYPYVLDAASKAQLNPASPLFRHRSARP